MLCTYCKTTRVENEAPCPHCGAPSPLSRQVQQGSWWGNSNQGQPNIGAQGTSFGAQWEQQQAPQMSFDNSPMSGQQPSSQFNNAPMPSWQQPSGQLNNAPMPSWQQPSGQFNNAPMPSWQQPSGQLNNGSAMNWQQNSGQLGVQGSPQADNQSMLPVPYQEGMALEPAGRQPTLSLQLVPEHAVQHLLPAELEAPDVVHVPPMYTQPRPIIPKKRAISGLLSTIIVALLLCGGVSYYAKASGMLDSVIAFASGNPGSLQNITPPQASIPDPLPPKPGITTNEIPSAALAARINSSNQPIAPQYIFQPGQKFYVTFSVQPPQNTNGTVIAICYTNNKYYAQQPELITYNPNQTYNFKWTQQFSQPLPGRVELYWQPQAAKGKTAKPVLEQTLYFAVK